jgi:hypothetical protein
MIWTLVLSLVPYVAMADLGSLTVKKEVHSIKSAPPSLGCKVPPELQVAVKEGSLVWDSQAGHLRAIVQLHNSGSKEIKICRLSYSYSPFGPVAELELEALKEKTIKRTGPLHGSGFGADYYPDPSRDTVTKFEYTLPARATVDLEAFSRSLRDRYSYKKGTRAKVSFKTPWGQGLVNPSYLLP